MAAFVHRPALCESDTIGDGTRIWAFAHVMDGGLSAEIVMSAIMHS